MVASLTYRSADLTKWGAGLGSNLSAAQIDTNFWTLFAALQSVEDTQHTVADIDYFTVVADSLYITMTDHRVLGPLKIPTSQWNYRGTWVAATIYAANDIVTNNGAIYLVITPHTSNSSFSAGAVDGTGHPYYGLLLEQPGNVMPVGGTVNQRLTKASSTDYATVWASERIRLALYVEGQPTSNEVLLTYVVVDNMQLPAGLTGSVFASDVHPLVDAQFYISKNGADIGSFTLQAGAITPYAAISFPYDVTFVPGDTITITAPYTVDAALANISTTLVATLA